MRTAKRFKAGDIVTIKTEEHIKATKGVTENKWGGYLFPGGRHFTEEMLKYAGTKKRIAGVVNIDMSDQYYQLKGLDWCWEDDMFVESSGRVGSLYRHKLL